MINWFDKISTAKDLTPIVEAYEYYSSEYILISKQLEEKSLKLIKIEDVSTRLVGWSDQAYARWSELKAIVELLDIKILVAVQKARKHYTENYARDLGAQRVEKYADADKEVVDLKELQISMRLILNKWEGISKAVDKLSFQLRLIVDLRKAGIEEATL